MALNDKQQVVFTLICGHVAEGQSLRQACNAEGIERSKVNRWLLDDVRYGAGDLSNQYAQAREMQADSHAGDILEIADNQDLDPNSRRIMVDARKWTASKLKPRVYGDKLALGGADDLPAIKQEVQERADGFTEGILGLANRASTDKATKH